MIRCWAILIMLRALMTGRASGNVIVSTAEETELTSLNNPDENQPLCKKCLCRVNSGCSEDQTAVCRSAGPMCCCCMPGLYPCSNMADLMQAPDDDSLGALEEGLENIGRLER